MKSVKQTAMSALLLLAVTALSGCSGPQTPEPANELRFDLTGIREIKIGYNSEQITFIQGTGRELVIKEYMTTDKNRYHARVEQNSQTIRISEGGHPRFRPDFKRSVEVFLPAAYDKDLLVTTTSGELQLNDALCGLSRLRVDTTSGTVRAETIRAEDIHLSTKKGVLEPGKIQAEQIVLETTSGTVRCDALRGAVTYTTTSGSLDVKSAEGSGTYRAENDGGLKVAYQSVTGDLSLYNKNGPVYLKLPTGLAFDFKASSKNGAIETDFQNALTSDAKAVCGSVGETPSVSVELETKNGDIHVGR